MPATRELNPTAGPLDFFGAEVRRWQNAPASVRNRADGLFGRLYDLARHWDGGYPSWFTEWVEAERRAMSSDDQLDQLVNARIERHAIFQQEGPPSLWAVLDERLLGAFSIAAFANAPGIGASRDLIRKVAEERWTT
jgi:hypothetical protein